MMKKEAVAARHSLVVKANDLIQKSRFSLSLQQQKIVLYLISQIEPQDEDLKLYKFNIPDFCTTCGIDETSGKNYKTLKRDLQELRDKSVWVTIPDGRQTTVSWVEKVYLDTKSGTVQIKLDEDMKPFLLQLKDNFTQYELIWTLKFKSKYSIRLYELIKSVHYKELETYVREFSVEQLKKTMDAETYEQFKDFHTRALKPAVKEINEFSDKNLSYELIKQGRTVVMIKFTISTKDVIERLQLSDRIEKDLGTDQPTLIDQIEDAEKRRMQP